jgi:hypothetical protein
MSARGSLQRQLEKSLLACRDWPARSVTARELTPGGEEEAGFFEVPSMPRGRQLKPLVLNDDARLES